MLWYDDDGNSNNNNILIFFNLLEALHKLFYFTVLNEFRGLLKCKIIIIWV